ncbi:MAG: hypothetical protein M1834_001138 [Cirrosporium novae-zelandiae]|nr:MAG: hypothetical protein M1834_001138 [Cirrosporium novae-zelandiae]
MAPIPPSHQTNRVVIYHQTIHDRDGNHVSLLPLLTEEIAVTHIIVAAIHLNDPPGNIHLNDHPPSDPRFEQLWEEVDTLQFTGIKVLGMLGGAAKGSFKRLDGDILQFEQYYQPLRAMVLERHLDGLDLDVEEDMSLNGIIRLIERLHTDFGNDFLITMAPVATALMGGPHLSGFDYETLEVMMGSKIAFYNTQFYNGWGSLQNMTGYEVIIARGYPPEKVVIGMLTNPVNGGSGWVPFDLLERIVLSLKAQHLGFGGIMGWEYFNSLPGDKSRPWELWRRVATTLRADVFASAAATETPFIQ